MHRLYIIAVVIAVTLWAHSYGAVPRGIVARDRVDITEVAHFYDDRGKLVFDQLVWWDFFPNRNRFHVVAWRMLKAPEHCPQREHASGDYVTRWWDDSVGYTGLREVRSKAFRETWEQVDVELIDREAFPRECRRELSRTRR